jgi:SAM-dependent methyltransferase
MVGDERHTGRGPAELAAPGLSAPGLSGTELSGTERSAAGLTAGLRAGYDAAADDWAAGPGPMYDRLAAALVAAAPVPLVGRLVLDLGAGAGVAGRAALAGGARRVVGADLSEGMLRRGHGESPVVADALALPFRDRSFDLVVAAFCLNHLGRLEAGLAEVRRVGAVLAASLFAPGWTHPAKDAVDAAVRAFGYRPPAWHTVLAPGARASDPEVLAGYAAAAGFTDVRAYVTAVPTGLAAPAELAAWRLGMAHLAPFMRSLDPPARAAVRRAAEQAVEDTGPLVVSMLVLTAS